MDRAMDRARESLRSGDWLTSERIRLIAVVLLTASALGLLFLVVTAQSGIDLQGRPLGTDFANVYAAGTFANEGNAAAAFDPVQQFARERAIFGEATQFYGWHYPPFFLFIASALARLPYGVALAVWQALTLGLYLLVIRAIIAASNPSPERGVSANVDPFWLLVALAFPAVLINVGHGQNGFLTAALLGGALVLLDRRPLLAGILFGCLAYKPQYGIMIPVALAASGRWRCFAAAAAMVAALAIATTLTFGASVWQAFLASTEFTRTVVLEQGNTGWHKIQSVFAWARMWGAPIPLAYVLQGATIVALGAALVWLWRSAAPYPLKAAALCLATILATPYSFDYDMMVLAPAIAYLAVDGFARGFAPWQKTVLAALWLMPLVARSIAQLSLIPLGVPAMLLVFAMLLRKAGFWLAPSDLTESMVFSEASSTMAPGPNGTSRGHDIAAFKS